MLFNTRYMIYNKNIKNTMYLDLIRFSQQIIILNQSCTGLKSILGLIHTLGILYSFIIRLLYIQQSVLYINIQIQFKLYRYNYQEFTQIMAQRQYFLKLLILSFDIYKSQLSKSLITRSLARVQRIKELRLNRSSYLKQLYLSSK